MVSGKQPIMVLKQDCNSTVNLVRENLNNQGYLVVQSCELHSDIAINPNFVNHIVILLVYRHNNSPATLIFAANNTGTSIFLEINPEQSMRSEIINCVQNMKMDYMEDFDSQIPLPVSRI
jgi:hypothetical protein